MGNENEVEVKKNKPNGCLLFGLGCLGLIVLGFFFLLIIGIIFAPSPSDIESQNISTTSQSDKPKSALHKAAKNHAHPLNVIENKVADDALEEYNIAKRQGDKIQVCVQAGLVSAAFLQAKDEPNYNKWKATEKADCRAAGMPNY